MRTRLISVLVALLVAIGAPAFGATETDRDGQGPQRPALDILRGGFTYADRANFRVKFEVLSKRRTRMIARFIRPGYAVSVETKFRDGVMRKKVQRCGEDGCARLSLKGVRVKWDFGRDVIKVSMPDRMISGSEADFFAFSLPKDAMHGHHFGDDLYRTVERY